MSKQYEYDVIGYMTISVHTRVKAHSVTEAQQQAAKRYPIDLCMHCGGEEELSEAWCPCAGLDGEARIE